eukprot:2019903-Alexandrium_andersonii.AAC.1
MWTLHLCDTSQPHSRRGLRSERLDPLALDVAARLEVGVLEAPGGAVRVGGGTLSRLSPSLPLIASDPQH